MKTVHKHVYAKENTIQLLDSPVNGNKIADLGKGAWVGVMEQVGEWFKVITTEGYGYLPAEDTFIGDHFKLRVLCQVSENIRMQYQLSA